MNSNSPQIERIHFFFWIITLSVASILTLPVLIQDGMFMDGVLYSAVSHNLANGIGSFWFPSFSHTNMAGIQSSFHEQPPLLFGIQSLFFKVLGSSLYVERFYTFLMLILNIFLIKKVWEEIFRTKPEVKIISWFPVLLWATIPVCFWSFTHNMHENTVSVFTLGAVLFLVKAVHVNERVHYLYLILAASFVFLASFSKGIPGLFPLAAPFAFCLVKQLSLKRAFLFSGFMFGIVSLVYAALLINESAQTSLHHYVYLRLFQRISEVPTTNNYFDTLFRLFMEILPMIGLSLIMKLRWSKKGRKESNSNSYFIIFLIIGLTGVLPLMLTLVQKGFYMLPALPFIAIAFASISYHNLMDWTQALYLKKEFLLTLKLTALLLVLSTLILTSLNVGKYSRNKELLEDVHQLGKIIPSRTVINCTYDLQRDWSLQTYLSRYYFISIDTNEPHDYYLADKQEYDSQKNQSLKDYLVINQDLNQYILLKKEY